MFRLPDKRLIEGDDTVVVFFPMQWLLFYVVQEDHNIVSSTDCHDIIRDFSQASLLAHARERTRAQSQGFVAVVHLWSDLICNCLVDAVSVGKLARACLIAIHVLYLWLT